MTVDKDTDSPIIDSMVMVISVERENVVIYTGHLIINIFTSLCPWSQAVILFFLFRSPQTSTFSWAWKWHVSFSSVWNIFTAGGVLAVECICHIGRCLVVTGKVLYGVLARYGICPFSWCQCSGKIYSALAHFLSFREVKMISR